MRGHHQESKVWKTDGEPRGVVSRRSREEGGQAAEEGWQRQVLPEAHGG